MMPGTRTRPHAACQPVVESQSRHLEAHLKSCGRSTPHPYSSLGWNVHDERLLQNALSFQEESQPAADYNIGSGEPDDAGDKNQAPRRLPARRRVTVTAPGGSPQVVRPLGPKARSTTGTGRLTATSSENKDGAAVNGVAVTSRRPRRQTTADCVGAQANAEDPRRKLAIEMFHTSTRHVGDVEFHIWGRISSLIAFAVGLVLKSGMARVPEGEKLRIVELDTKEYSQRAVAAMVKRPLKTVNRIIQAFRDENRIKDAPQKPRPRVTTQEDDMNIVVYVDDNPRASLAPVFSTDRFKNNCEATAG
ncbi:hypothetical protein HPB49_006544 [Dermacentor silvarum]|uniref:Uncharacterized protein n=1 Tax=Dermacentor silvarum TaxID=543639 RepID=A0ACB8DX90_DERSI|nr:hypothetical protein HPB49_006544 [Dermacentor silvarum]